MIRQSQGKGGKDGMSRLSRVREREYNQTVSG